MLPDRESTSRFLRNGGEIAIFGPLAESLQVADAVNPPVIEKVQPGLSELF
jgi:hypothetical protein